MLHAKTCRDVLLHSLGEYAIPCTGKRCCNKHGAQHGDSAWLLPGCAGQLQAASMLDNGMRLKQKDTLLLWLQVYSWFLGTYNVSVAVGILGYLLLIAELFLASSGASRGSSGGTREGSGRPPAYKFRGMGAVVLWYGLYFGVLGRDAAEVAADRMVRAHLGQTLSGLHVHMKVVAQNLSGGITCAHEGGCAVLSLGEQTCQYSELRDRVSMLLPSGPFLQA